MLQSVQCVADKGPVFFEVSLDRAQRSALDRVELVSVTLSRRMEPNGSEVLCDIVKATLRGHVGRSQFSVAGVAQCDARIRTSLNKCAHNSYMVSGGGVDERGVTPLLFDVDVALVFDKQFHNRRVAVPRHNVQRSPPVLILPINRSSSCYECLGPVRISICDGRQKVLCEQNPDV